MGHRRSGSAFLLIRTIFAGQLQRQRSDLVNGERDLQRRRESAGNHESGPHRSAVVLEFHVSTRWRRAQSQSVSLSSSSSTQLNFTTTVSTVLGTAVFATVNQNSGSTPFSLGIGSTRPFSPCLGRNVRQQCVIASNNAGNSPVSVQVTLVVSGNAALTANPPSLALNYQIGQMQPPNQSVTISSTATAIQFNTSAISSNCGTFLVCLRPAPALRPALA